MDGATRLETPDGSCDAIAWLAARELENSWLCRLHFYPHDNGMYEVEGRLCPEVGTVLIQALEAAEEELFGRQRTEGNGATSGSTEQRRADAFVLVLERVAETLEAADRPPG
ncbi:MAG: hypothetical protein ACOC9H_00550 [Gemmatimonadota bacterium]